MKQLLPGLILVFCAGVLCAAPNSPTEVSYSLLKTAPEKHKGKLITYSEVFRDFATTFPPYVEDSGIKSSRWLMLVIGDMKVPVLVRKKDDVTAMVSDLKAGTTVIVTGRVREFKVDPRAPMYAKYYVEADTIAPVADGGQPARMPRGGQPARMPRGGPLAPRRPPQPPAVQPPPF